MMPRRRRQVSGSNTTGDGDNGPITGESTKETVITVARGMPGETGVTVVTTLACLFYFACEAAGASSARHSLRPLPGGLKEISSQTSGATRGENAGLFLNVIARSASDEAIQASLWRDGL